MIYSFCRSGVPLRKKIYAILSSIILAFFLPSSIKTQWHANGFLSLSGDLSMAPNDLITHFVERDPSLQVLDYLELDLSSTVLPSRQDHDYTFEARIFLDDAEASASCMALADAENHQVAFRLHKAEGETFSAEFLAASSVRTKLSANKTIPAGTWLELAVVLDRIATDASLVRLYLNGERLAEHTMQADWRWPAAARLYLGGAPGAHSFNGKIDEVRVSATARYREPSYPVPQRHFADAYTIAQWQFEGEAIPSNAAYHWRQCDNGVQFSGFSAKRQISQSVRLEWGTSFEQGLESFVIERRGAAADAQFERCGYMPAMANSRRAQSYHFVDTPPARENSYYRLRIVDRDGNCAFSNEVASEFERRD